MKNTKNIARHGIFIKIRNLPDFPYIENIIYNNIRRCKNTKLTNFTNKHGFTKMPITNITISDFKKKIIPQNP